MRSTLLAAFVLVLALLVPAGAGAEPVPPFDGLMTFPDIQGPDGPEEFSWEVKFGEDEELKSIDDQHAGVFWEDGTQAMTIRAEPAHDAEGKPVPTTLAVTQPNIITLTVHHVGGSFRYPISPGEGYETGFATVTVIMPPGEQPAPEPTCLVPDLTGRSLRASRKILHAANCRLGRVRGERNRAVHVVTQYRQVGKALPAWTRVDVKALSAQYSRSS